MSKRNRGLPRHDHDNYPTPCEAVEPAIRWIEVDGRNFCEPCAGERKLVEHLNARGFNCVYHGDIRTGQDAMKWRNSQRTMIVTNPPWSRRVLHPMIDHFVSFKCPVWLLLDADWMHTKQATPYLAFCTTIVSIGRVRWMPGTLMTSYDNAAWYRFWWENHRCPVFVPRAKP